MTAIYGSCYRGVDISDRPRSGAVGEELRFADYMTQAGLMGNEKTKLWLKVCAAAHLDVLCLCILRYLANRPSHFAQLSVLRLT